jgi:class 3 adenylate cyclase
MTTFMPQQSNQQTLEEWAGAKHLSLTLLFTDIVQSTSIGIKLGDRRWVEDLIVHFNQGRGLAITYDSYVVKVIGDALMIAFRTSSEAVGFALDFASFTGIDYIGIRVGIHSGQVQIRENDIYGLNVNLTSRVQHALSGEGILVTASVKGDYENRFGLDSGVRFVPQDVDLRSFGKQVVYRVRRPNLVQAFRQQREARYKLLETSKAPSWLI